MKRKPMFLASTIAAAALSLVLVQRGDGWMRPAIASPTGPASAPTGLAAVPIARITQDAKPKKADPEPASGNDFARVPECALAAYAALATEAKSLADLHGPDVAAFRAAYAKRKHELVGVAALAAKGCRR